jgi:hypothetical protein
MSPKKPLQRHNEKEPERDPSAKPWWFGEGY